MNKRTGFLAALALMLAGAALLWAGLERPIRVYTPEGEQTVSTRSRSIQNILWQTGVALSPYDQVEPPSDTAAGWDAFIWVQRASSYRVLDLARGLDISLPSRERLPANVLQEAGIALFPGDQVLWNGQTIDPSQPLPYHTAYLLQVIPAFEVQVQIEGASEKFSSAAPTLGQALWEQGNLLYTGDQVSHRLNSPLRFLDTVSIRRARPVHIQVEGVVIDYFVAADTVGEALNQAGISLQGLDYSYPPENNLLPTGGAVTVVRVHEQLMLEQTALPFETNTVTDPDIPLGERQVLESGQYGLKISRERIRFENDQETARTRDAEWVAVEPVAELVAVGSKVVLNVVDTPEGPMEYWRSLTAYATSYSPCRLGTGSCSYTTAAGMELKKGVIAVKCSLFSSLRGQRVFIPGYGVAVIGDCGGGVAGSFWVDLGFSDDDYESWHQAVTVYFLAPPPATIPYELQ